MGLIKGDTRSLDSGSYCDINVGVQYCYTTTGYIIMLL